MKFPSEIMQCACCWSVGNHNHFKDSGIQIFLNGDVLLNGSLVDLDGTLKWSRGRTVVVQGERHQRRLAIRTEDTGHVSKLCAETMFISENFHS